MEIPEIHLPPPNLQQEQLASITQKNAQVEITSQAKSADYVEKEYQGESEMFDKNGQSYLISIPREGQTSKFPREEPTIVSSQYFTEDPCNSKKTCDGTKCEGKHITIKKYSDGKETRSVQTFKGYCSKYAYTRSFDREYLGSCTCVTPVEHTT
ncbi:hypothetical protein COV18_01385 [Candidatus Woesearchaeota archaeon CG10_big_fil_rev_8_21_14_0_10_37_12]|nr:MAG: hypothetical protein COV18_01385 [Candidatus Woesearchaeota archaeon CG10_big_fil_rev_8_21_14_0_10_37_12]